VSIRASGSPITVVSTTAGVQLSPTASANIDTAVTEAGKWLANNAGTIEIILPTGIIERTAAIQLNAATLDRLQMYCATGPTFLPLDTGTGDAFVSLTTPDNENQYITLKFTSIGSVVPGDFLYVNVLAGTGDYNLFLGLWEVDSIDAINNYITFHTKARVEPGDVVPPTITSGNIRRARCILKTTNNTPGIVVNGRQGNGSASTLRLYRFALVNLTYQSSALLIEPNASVCVGTDFAIHGYQYGIRTVNGGYAFCPVLTPPSVIVSGCDLNGIYSLTGSALNLPSAIVTGCGSRGFVASAAELAVSGSQSHGNLSAYEASSGAVLFANSALAHKNREFAFMAEEVSFIHANAAIATDNTLSATAGRQNTVIARTNGYVSFINGTATGSVDADLHAENGGLIVADGATYGTADPPLDIFGNQCGLIASEDIGVTEPQRFEEIAVGASGTICVDRRRVTLTHDFGTVTPTTDATSTTTTVSGIADDGTWTVGSVTYSGALVTALSAFAKITASNTLTWNIRNTQGVGNVVPGSRTYYVVLEKWA